MEPLQRAEAKRRGQARLGALKRRAARLRRRVMAVTAIGFAVLWIAISVQMATGHDPVLSRTAANVTAAAKESVASDPERRERSAEEQIEADSEQIEAEELELEAVTTSQS